LRVPPPPLALPARRSSDLCVDPLRQNTSLSMGTASASLPRQGVCRRWPQSPVLVGLPLYPAAGASDVQDVLAQTLPQDVAYLVCGPLLLFPQKLFGGTSIHVQSQESTVLRSKQPL